MEHAEWGRDLNFPIIQGENYLVADTMQPTGLAGGGQPKDQPSSGLDLLHGELVQARDAPAEVVTISNNHASHHHAPQYPPTALAHAQAHAARAHVGGGASGMAAGDQKVFDKLFEHGNGFVDEEPPAKPEGGEAKEEEKPKLPPVPLTQLWRFSSRGDKILLCFGCFCGCVVGAVLPLFTLVFGALIDILNSRTSTVQQQAGEIEKLCIYFVYIAIASGIAAFVEGTVPVYVAEKCLRTLRHKYMEALLRQDMAWHDTNRAGEATARLAEATLAMSTGMEKFSTAIKSFCTLIVGIVIGFTTSWKLTLVIMGCAPFFAISLAVLIVSITQTEAKSIKAYARAGDVANEVFSQIRTVAGYNGEQHEVGRYDIFLARAEQAGISKGKATGFSVGCLLFSFYAMYGISTWAGAEFVLESRAADPLCAYDLQRAGCFTGGKVVQTFIAVLLGAVSFGSVGPIIGNVVAARAAAAQLYKIIDEEPEVDSAKTGGHQGQLKGKIEFINCTFSYPSRPDQVVLRNFSMTIEPGQTVALVGPSGSGKSTIIGLLERFYELREGQVLIDGVPTRDWDLKCLRDQIGLVQQDPLLFGIPICDNIAMGLTGEKDMTGSGKLSAEVMQLVTDAAKAANAHGFISKLPKGYRTPAGTSVSSTQLSGGQRQRVCIARSIIRKPRLLLLDEATSALDTESERIVQASLDQILSDGGALGKGVTTIMIAHRLSTVTNADKIVVLERGAIVEMGTHSELMSNSQGLYHAMRKVQDLAHAEESSSVLGPATADVKSKSMSMDEPLVDDRLQRLPSEDDSKKQKNNSEMQMMEEAKSLPKVPLSKIWADQKEELPYIILGVITAMGGGTIQPIFAVIYSGIIAVFFLPDDEAMRAKAKEYLGWFFALGIAAFFTVLLRISCFTYIGERLTRKLRKKSFESSLRQDMSYYDDTKNSVGRIATRLATDATLVKGITGDILGSVLEGCSALIAALVIAYVASWRLALVLTAVFPLLIFGAVFEFKNITQETGSSNKELEVSGEIVSDAITAIRTVSAFNLQHSVLDLFDKSLIFPMKSGKKRGLVQGLGSGFKQFVSMSSYAIAFYAGSRFMADGLLTFDMLIRVFLAITLASEGIGRITSSAPDTAKAQAAARSVYHQIDMAANGTPIDPMDESKGIKPAAPVRGHIEFRNVWFAYPQRPDIQVLKNFSAVIQPGQTVALVGESGSGKSTIMQLVQRLYNPSQGEILLDGQPIASYNVSWLRSQFGMVQQEPALFADSILYNIGYGTASTTKPQPNMGAPVAKSDEDDEEDKKGKKGNKGKKGKEDEEPVVDPTAWTQPTQIELAAARDANASSFIDTLVNKYATHVGSRGSQLSGGQKQRVAIARAIMRDPPILLLDEATSALDTKSEQLVQEALDKLLQNSTVQRTTFVIAHRLSTIQKADRIIVLERGTVIEDGSHDQLVSKPDGAYRKLAMAQSAAKH